MSSTNRKALLAQVDKRWLGAGLAAAGAAAAADKANAAIVYHAPVGGINIPASFAGVYLNLETEALSTASGGAVPGWDFNPYGSGYFRLFTNTGGGVLGSLVGTTKVAHNLAPGADVCTGAPGTAGTFQTGVVQTAGSPLPLNFNSSNNLVGVRFVDALSNTRFAWVRLSLGASPGGAPPQSVVEWAYDDGGACIGAGVVPEPTSLAMLAAGAVGLVARRRRMA